MIDKIEICLKTGGALPTDLKMLGIPIPVYQHVALDRLKEQTGWSKQELVAKAIDEFLRRVHVIQQE